jgi:hypothetical protein
MDKHRRERSCFRVRPQLPRRLQLRRGDPVASTDGVDDIGKGKFTSPLLFGRPQRLIREGVTPEKQPLTIPIVEVNCVFR